MTIEMSAGNIMRNTVTFVPGAGGTVALADISVWLVAPTGAKTALTPALVSGLTYTADATIADAAGNGKYRFRWEVRTPSAHITVEDETTEFLVLASKAIKP